jgi:hypothetical protein
MKQTKSQIESLAYQKIKANEATVLRYKYPEPENQKFYQGRYMAFSEMYSLLCNLEKHI